MKMLFVIVTAFALHTDVQYDISNKDRMYAQMYYRLCKNVQDFEMAFGAAPHSVRRIQNK